MTSATREGLLYKGTAGLEWCGFSLSRHMSGSQISCLLVKLALWFKACVLGVKGLPCTTQTVFFRSLRVVDYDVEY
jgi:hypothetical protein